MYNVGLSKSVGSIAFKGLNVTRKDSLKESQNVSFTGLAPVIVGGGVLIFLIGGGVNLVKTAIDIVKTKLDMMKVQKAAEKEIIEKQT